MRVGSNPLKERRLLPAYKRHRVIMPVYIPSSEGYFADAAAIFRMSFDSLVATVDREHVSITLIDNACIPEVSALLQQALDDGRIDKLVRNGINRGKDAAIAGELLASHEPFVTLADADVLFLQGWLDAVEQVFETWPAAGAVSPGAQPKPAFYLDDTTWAHGVLTAQLRCGKFVSDEDMLQFARSIGREDLYPGHELRSQYALVRGDTSALVGAGHFVVTLRRRCYDRFAFEPTMEGTSPRGMRQIDAQVDAGGWLRLSTTRAHVLHLGNTPEPWMAPLCRAQTEASLAPLAPAGQWDQVEQRRQGTRMPRPLVRAVAAPAKLAALAQMRIARGKRQNDAGDVGAEPTPPRSLEGND